MMNQRFRVRAVVDVSLTPSRQFVKSSSVVPRFKRRSQAAVRDDRINEYPITYLNNESENEEAVYQVKCSNRYKEGRDQRHVLY